MPYLSHEDFRRVHRVLQAVIESQLGGSVPTPSVVLEAGSRALSGEEGQQARRWLGLLDLAASPYLFRTAIGRMNPAAEESHALLRYLAGKDPLSREDVERMEWLATWLFRRHAARWSDDFPAVILKEVHDCLGSVRPPLSTGAEVSLLELAQVAARVCRCAVFEELIGSGLMDAARRLKHEFRDEVSHPRVLSAIVLYNLEAGDHFDRLLGTALAQHPELPEELKTSEYRAASIAFRSIAATPEPEPAAPVNTAGSAMKNGAGSQPDENATRMGILGTDPQVEETKLRAMVGAICTFARSADEAACAIPLPNASLLVSPWELQALRLDYPENEISFRAELNRALRRAMSLLACMEEECSLYKVRRFSEYLWKKHLNSLAYLLHHARRNLPELKKLVAEASRRGLYRKAQELNETAARLCTRVDEVYALCEQALPSMDAEPLRPFGPVGQEARL